MNDDRNETGHAPHSRRSDGPYRVTFIELLQIEINFERLKRPMKA